MPLSLIYHDLPLALNKPLVKIAVDPSTGDITFTNVGEISSRSLYTIGFKVGFMGTETLNFLGENSFGAIQVTDSTGLVTIVSRKAPPGVKSSFKQPIVNNRFVSDTGTPLNLMTYMHTRNIAQTNYGYTATSVALSSIGLRSGSNKIMHLTFRNLNTFFVGAVTDKQTFLEVFTT